MREIDALGGLMGRVADKSGISFKVLNSSKGAAVHGPRGQMDRDLYKANMVEALFGEKAKEETGNRLELYQGSVRDLLVEEGKCVGVLLEDGTTLRSKSVVLTTGTFLGAMCHIGQESFPAGRFMRHNLNSGEGDQIKLEPPSNALSQSIRKLGFPIARLRTGTPPRLSKQSIDYEGLQA